MGFGTCSGVMIPLYGCYAPLSVVGKYRRAILAVYPLGGMYIFIAIQIAAQSDMDTTRCPSIASA